MKILKKILGKGLEEESVVEAVVSTNTTVDPDIELVANSNILDESFYLETNPDVAASTFSAVEHFAKYGWKEGRKPSKDINIDVIKGLQNEKGNEIDLSILIELILEDISNSKKITENSHNSFSHQTSNSSVDVRRDWKDGYDIEEIRSGFIAKFHEKGHSGDSFLDLLLDMFCPESYVSENEDVKDAGVDPVKHYFQWGFFEGRLPCSVQHLETFIENKLKSSAYQHYPEANEYEFFSGEGSPLEIGICFNSDGNFFFKEIANHLNGALLEAGHQVICVDHNEILDTDCDFYFLVAPHEAYSLAEDNTLYSFFKEKMPKVAYFLTEQPQTTFFLKQLPYLFDNVQLVEMNLEGAKYLRSLNLNSHYLPLGYFENLDYSSQKSFSDSSSGMYLSRKVKDFDFTKSGIMNRPIDVSFVGNCCPRRSEFFAEYAEFFSSIESALFLPDWNLPHSENSVATLNTNDSLALAQRSKVFLNVHRDRFNYFEWHRLVLRGMISGAVVVTEPVRSVPGFVSGIHYLECSLDEMPNLINWLLNTEEGKQKMLDVQHQAYVAIKRISCSEKLNKLFAYWEYQKDDGISIG